MLIQADARRIPLQDGCVQCAVTSPPYFRQRDYGIAGQIGQEATAGEFISTMLGVFDELWRVLRPDGTVWLNIGDGFDEASGVLLAVPWRLVIALSDDGWRLETDVVWSKPKGAPAGGDRRPVRSHEYVFLLSKNESYFYDPEPLREPLAQATLDRYRYSVKKINSRASGADARKMLTPHPVGRQSRTVWSITPTHARDDGDHRAVMPPVLAQRCILAGSRPGDLVLDPFGGSGTTVKAARRLNRRGVMLDLNANYLQLAQERISGVQVSLLESELTA